MRYKDVHIGKFISRPNRFIAHVELDGEIVVCHVKNTGRCRELLIPGARVVLEKAQNPARKTKYDLIAVWKGELLINMDSQAPNIAFGEWARETGFPFGDCELRAETTHGDSRFDFYYNSRNASGFIEVKGVTLETDGVVKFPDAPTERGAKHLRGLMNCVNEGYGAYAVFVVQMSGMKYFTPNADTDPEFARTLKEAAESGVNIIALECRVEEDGLFIEGEIPVQLY